MKMKHLLLSGLTLTFLLSSKQNTYAQTGSAVPGLEIFDIAMTNLLADYNIRGGQLALTYKGRLIYSRGFGYANTSTSTLVQPKSIFRVASLSKPVTSVAILKLVEEGQINLSDQVFGVNGILNDAMYQNPIDPSVNSITVRHLLEHTAGWNSSVSGDAFFGTWFGTSTPFQITLGMGVPAPGTVQSTIKYVLENIYLDNNPGTYSAYGNIGHAILGQVIEKVTGQGYENYVRDSILIPLNITNMHLGRTDLINQLPMEVNYYNNYNSTVSSIYDGSTLVPGAYGGYCMENLGAASGWVASAEDMCLWLTAVDGFSSKPDILQASTIAQMVTPSAAYSGFGMAFYLNSFDNNWFHYESLFSTCDGELARRGDEVSGVILLNTKANVGNVQAAINDILYALPSVITTWPTNDFFLGVEDQTKDFIMSLYPNPTSDIINVKTAVNSIGSPYKIYDNMGRTVLSGIIHDENTSIVVSNLSGGIYLFKVGENSIQTFEIIKE
jgi:CubicO group peptidase (beta-lactamase class C family)